MYNVILKKKADKYLKLLDRKTQVKILEILDKLSVWDVKWLDLKPMEGFENLWRIRLGKYRIIFEKYDNKLVIIVVKIWPRWDVYKDF
jgi:mRNA interferase RelE/StbE